MGNFPIFPRPSRDSKGFSDRRRCTCWILIVCIALASERASDKVADTKSLRSENAKHFYFQLRRGEKSVSLSSPSNITPPPPPTRARKNGQFSNFFLSRAAVWPRYEIFPSTRLKCPLHLLEFSFDQLNHGDFDCFGSQKHFLM